MWSNILVIIFMAAFAGALIFAGLSSDSASEFLWSGSGIVGYTIVSAIQVYNSPEDDISQDSSAGQAFLLALLLGPLFCAMLISIIVEGYTRRKENEN